MRLFILPSDLDPVALAAAGEELWAPTWVPDYWASNLGKVISTKSDTLLKTHLVQGYDVVHLGRGRSQFVHRIVFFSFFPQADRRCRVQHVDKQKTNNALCNLVQRQKPDLTPEQQAELRRLIQAGLRTKDIAATIGTTPMNVSHYRRRPMKGGGKR